MNPSAENEDWEWAAEWLSGNEAAFQRLFEKHKVSVINLAFRFLRQRQAAEDIAQDVFIKIYEKKFSLDHKAKFSTWLYRVTVNASLDLLRRKKLTPQSLDAETVDVKGKKRTLLENTAASSSSSPRQTVQDEEIQDKVRKVIDALPEKFRTPILLYQFEELSYREIAVILGVTEKAVEKRLYHAKEILRKKLSFLL